MKALLSTVAATLLAAISPVRADLLLKPHDVVGIAGDSITAQKIYSIYIEDYLLMCQPADQLRAVNFGWGGETSPGFMERIENDLLPFHPNVVTTCYGMNDGHYHPKDPDNENAYRRGLEAAVKKLKAGGVRTIILGTPGCIDPAYFGHKETVTPTQYNETLRALGEIARDVAAKNDVVFADVHSAMISAMEKAKAVYGEKYDFGGGDGVHASASAHLAMAYAFLKAMGCDGAIGTITVNLATDKAEGTAGQKILSSQKGTIEIESTRYPFCFTGNPKQTEKPTNSTILPFLPFNEELNRYLLIVKGLKSARAKVTWGTESKEFTAAALEKGINLAAEFLVNPFVDPFHNVDEMIQAQQSQEGIFMTSFLHVAPRLKGQAPSQAAALDHLVSDGMGYEQKLFDLSVGRVTPVHHTLKIEAIP